MSRPKARRGPQSQTVDNAIRVLKMIAQEGKELGITEIAQRLDLYPSVVSRLVATLEYHTLVKQNPITKKYYLGMGAVELGTAAIRSMELVEVALPSLKKLNGSVGETVFLFVLDGAEGVYVAKFDSPQRIAIQSEVGHREPLHASSVGKAILAFLPEDELQAFFENGTLPRLTPKTITDPKGLTAHLEQVRHQGYAIDDEEGELGIRCIGAPVFDHRGYPVASVSISAPTFRTSLERLLEWKDSLFECTDQISRGLGFHRSV